MRYAFDPLKATQAAVYLMNHRDGRKNYMALVKLMYLADREALLKSGAPITGAGPCAMKNGMVLSEVLNAIKFAPSGSPWRDHISAPENYEVTVSQSFPRFDRLSQFEMSLLDDIDRRYGTESQFTLGKLTHELPEYRDPGGSSIMIDPSEILQKSGMDPEFIRDIEAQAEADATLDQLIGR